MKFGEKVRAARQNAGMSQEALAKAVQVSLRTISGYENEMRYPKKREIYGRLAESLGVEVNYLLSEDGEQEAPHGVQSRQRAALLTAELNGMFIGGKLADADMDATMRALQEAYWVAKENSRRSAAGDHAKARECP